MYKNCIKRAIDFIIALCAFPFVLLLCIVVWIAIKCDDGGPLFHMASRIGKNGRIFKMFKFRSMVTNADELLKNLLDHNEVDGAMFKMESVKYLV